jgi:hypothetical protein
MDIGKAFTFVFDDEDWITKVLVGALFVLASMVLVGIPFLLGYTIALMRNVMRGMEKPLPAWDELGEKFKEGLILILIFVVWAAPIWLIACLQWIVTAAFANSQDAAGIISFISICTSCISGIWGLVIALFSPAIYIRFADNPEFKSGFEFAEIWQFTKDNIGNVIIAILLGWVASVVAQFGVILCVIGWFATTFWAAVVQGHLYAQVWLDRKGALIESLDIEPLDLESVDLGSAE